MIAEGVSRVELTLDLDLGIRLVIQERASIVGESPVTIINAAFIHLEFHRAGEE
jgi:hypothetical protein